MRTLNEIWRVRGCITHISLNNQTQIGITAPAAQPVHRRPSQVQTSNCDKTYLASNFPGLKPKMKTRFHTHLHKHGLCLPAIGIGTSLFGPNLAVAAYMPQTPP